MNPLEERIKYKFRNPLLLAEALTHPSLGHEIQRHHFDNQRLEFLGDAVLQLIFTEYLFDHYPDFSEGTLTKLRARLVSRDGLRQHAELLELGRYIMMGRGEEAAGGRKRASALADAYEALVGAIYLDSDYVTARRIVITEAREFLDTLDPDPTDSNPKGQLQEILQGISPISPIYPTIGQTGPDHAKLFTSTVNWLGEELGRGTGRSKKEAEINAASNAIEQRIWENMSRVRRVVASRESSANKPPTPADNRQQPARE